MEYREPQSNIIKNSLIRRSSISERTKITLPDLLKKVAANEPITMLTYYDYPTGYFQEQAGEVILNGLKQCAEEVQTKQFPEKQNYFGIKDEEYD